MMTRTKEIFKSPQLILIKVQHIDLGVRVRFDKSSSLPGQTDTKPR